MRDYEALLVIQPNLDDEGMNALVALVGDIVRRNGGEVALVGQLVDKRGNVAEVAETWNKRRLAYLIKGHREGYYAVLRLKLPPEAVAPIEASLTINEDVLRYLIVRTDEIAQPAEE
jgi:small subunit ribosomal protein S6